MGFDTIMGPHRHGMPLTTVPEDKSCREWSFKNKETTRNNEWKPERRKLRLYVESLDLINRERRDRGITPLKLNTLLAKMAQRHAITMASQENVFHSVQSIEELKRLMASDKVGENIQRGDSVLCMHMETMQEEKSVNRSNLLSSHFTEFGAGSCIGKDGKIYSCQLFRHR